MGVKIPEIHRNQFNPVQFFQGDCLVPDLSLTNTQLENYTCLTKWKKFNNNCWKVFGSILQLQRASRKDTKDELLERLIKVDLLILGEFGYLPLKEELGPFLYELIAGRYEEKSTVITSNKSLNEWGKTLRDNSLAQALIDRLIHHGEVYYLEGDSYRLKGKQDLLGRADSRNQGQSEKKVSAGEEKSTESSEN